MRNPAPFSIVWPLDDNKVPGHPLDASASWKGGVLIVYPLDDNKVPGHPPDASELLPVKKTVKKYNIFDQ